MSKRNVSRSDSRIRSGEKGTPDDRDGCRVFLGCFMALALLVWLINLMGTTSIVFFLLTLGAAYSLYFLYKTRTNAKRAREGEFTTGTETLKQPMDVLKRFQDRMPMPLWLPDSVFAMEQAVVRIMRRHAVVSGLHAVKAWRPEPTTARCLQWEQDVSGM